MYTIIHITYHNTKKHRYGEEKADCGVRTELQ